MAMNKGVKIDDRKYNLDDKKTAPSYTPKTISNYMGQRILGINFSNNLQDSLRNFALKNTLTTSKASPATTSHGLVSVIDNSKFSSTSSIDIINREHTVEEHRELTQLNEKLNEIILRCSSLEAHNRAQELQIEWLKTHFNNNPLIIKKMFHIEIQNSKQSIHDALRYKSDLEKKLNDIHQTTLGSDEHYQRLIAKRNAIHKELFVYQRQLIQKRAESEFLRYRIQYLNDEFQFYTLKNQSLEGRQIKLRYEVNEEIFAKQNLQMEFEVLENEKTTNEDIYLTSMANVRSLVNMNELTTIQPSNSYREQLNYQIRHLRIEYERKIQIYRDELHRKYELVFHRYKIDTLRSTTTVTRDQEQTLEDLKRDKQSTEQQISFVRGHINGIESEIKTLEKRISVEKRNPQPIINSRRHVTMLDDIIHERERELNRAIQTRTLLKQQIEKYRENIIDYPNILTQNSNDIEQLSSFSFISNIRNSMLQSTSQDIQFETNQQERLKPNISQLNIPLQRSERPRIIDTNDISVEEISGQFTDSDVQRDCQELNKIFNQANVDEISVIKIICNRNIAQRLLIRKTYRNLFGQNLDNIIEAEITGNCKNILQILLLSPSERDCYELRRILIDINNNENIFIEIFFSRSTKQIQNIVDTYFKLFQNTLEQNIINSQDTSSKQIFLTLLRTNRPENDNIPTHVVLDDAKHLYETNEKWRIDGSIFIQLLSIRSNAHLKQIFDAYQQFSGIDIEQYIKTYIDSDLSRTLMAIVRIVRNQARYFAYELRKSLKGSNTNEHNLTRIIVSRCEIDMGQIKSEYEKIAKRTLYDHIQTDTNGNYKRVLIELLSRRIESLNREPSFKQNLETTIAAKQPRINVQSNQLVNKQLFEKSKSNENINDKKQFNEKNQLKTNTPLRSNAKPTKSPLIGRRPILKRSYSNEDEIE